MLLESIHWDICPETKELIFKGIGDIYIYIYIYIDTQQENIISLKNFKIHLKASSNSNDTFFSLWEHVEQWGFSPKKKKRIGQWVLNSGPAGLVSNQSHKKENLWHRIQSILLEIYPIEKFITKTWGDNFQRYRWVREWLILAPKKKAWVSLSLICIVNHLFRPCHILKLCRKIWKIKLIDRNWFNNSCNDWTRSDFFFFF